MSLHARSDPQFLEVVKKNEDPSGWTDEGGACRVGGGRGDAVALGEVLAGWRGGGHEGAGRSQDHLKTKNLT